MASFAENQQEDVLEAIKALQNVNKDDVQDIVQALEYLSLADCFEEFDVFDSISTFLGMKGRGPEFVALHKQLAKCIAEITKGEKQREYFTHDNVCHCLLSNLARIEEAAAHGSNSELMEVMVQSCRALGNICYMNDEAREIVAKRDGDRILLRLLDFGNDNPAFYKVRCGLLSNYLIDGEEVSQRCLELGLVGKLSSIIAKSVSDKAINEELLVNILPLLSILTENVEPEMNFEDALNRNLAQILARSTSPDLAETCLELLHYESENDDVKTLLAKEGLCQSLFQLMEKNKTQANNEEARAIMKLACDLIVLILTGNDAMNLLHDTDLVANMESWVDEDDIILITTGVLALGNFARTDTHCIELVEKGLATKLLQILAKNNMPDSDVRLQHALLSTLRNLVIPQVNKGAVIEAGLIETMLPMLTSPPPHNYPVVFKLLGALRMTIDKQEQLALRLLQDRRLMEQLVEWGGNSDHMGVSGESLRLLAWLLKNAYLHKFRRNEEAMVVDEEEWDARGVLAFMQVPKAVKMMVSLLGSQHMVMQNEGLVTLLVMETILLRENDAAHIVELESLLVQADLGGMLLKFISTSSEVMTKEIVDNLNTLMKMVRQSPALCEHLARHDVEEQMKLVPVLVEYCTL